MTLILFGDPNRWTDALNMIQTYRPGITLYGFSALDLGSYQESDVTYTLREVQELYKQHLIDGVLQIHSENPYYFYILEDLGIANIYVIPSIISCKISQCEDISSDPIVYHYKDILPELIQLEFHLADHCNLNCKGCSHFSNLVPNPCFADKIQFAKDMNQLSLYFSQIHKFFFLGGEPLLNRELGDYIKIAHEAFPYSQIIIVTNGLLLLTLDDTTIDTIRNNHVHISISEYACLDREKLVTFIRRHRLSAELREGKENFSKFLNTRGDSNPHDIFYQCIRHNCTFLDKGKMAACCQPFLIKYFNHYFDETIPENECIDLYEDGLNGWTIQKRLTTPMNSCRYCTYDHSFDWDISHAPYSKSDWCVE